METALKIGDKVYYPSEDGGIHTLVLNDNHRLMDKYPLAVRDKYDRQIACFTVDGKLSEMQPTREIFLATEENRQKLMDLHGIHLEPAE